MGDFELVGSFEEFLASEEPRGGAGVRVQDATMEPVLYADDVVRVEKREAGEDDVLCVQVNGSCLFGYRSGNVLQRLNGPDVLLKGTEHVVGVATAVISREVRPRRG